AVRRDSVRRASDGRSAMLARVAHGRFAGAFLLMYLSRAWRRFAAGRRKLRLPARGVRTQPLGTPHVVPLYMANAVSRASEHCFGRPGLRKLFHLSHGQVEPARHSVIVAEFGAGESDC